MPVDDDQSLGEPGDELANEPMLATHTIDALEQAVAILCVDEPEEQLHKWLNLSAVLMARARELRRAVEGVAIGWIRAHGPVVVGDIRYTVGSRRDVRCIDNSKCIELILQAVAGDLDQIGEFLRADPFRYGSVKNLIGDKSFDKVFRVEVKPKLVAGTPHPELVRTNLKYLPRRKKPSAPSID